MPVPASLVGSLVGLVSGLVSLVGGVPCSPEVWSTPGSTVGISSTQRDPICGPKTNPNHTREYPTAYGTPVGGPGHAIRTFWESKS